MTKEKWLFLAFLALAMFASPVLHLVQSWWRRRSASGRTVVQAKVLYAEVESRAPRFGYRPRWDVEYDHEGERRQAQCHEANPQWYTGSDDTRTSVVRDVVERRLAAYPVGGTIPVRLRPDRPREVTLAHESLETGPLYLMLGITGVVALAMALMYLFL